MMGRLLRISAAVLLSASISVCSSPPTRFYSLSVLATATAPPLPVAISIGPVSIPGVVNSTRVVLNVGPNEVRPDEFHRWASPLQDGIARAVAADLAMVLGTSRVTIATDALGLDCDYRVKIDVQRFESIRGDAALFDAVWLVRRSADGMSKTGRTTLREAAQGGGVDALAAAHSRALARLSGDIGAAVRALVESAQ